MDVEVVLPGVQTPTDQVSSPRQLDDPFDQLYKGGIAMEPDFDIYCWADMVLHSTRYAQLARTYARNVAGQGWRIVPTIEVTKKTDEKLKVKVAQEVETLKRFYGRPQNRLQSHLFLEESLSEILIKTWIDHDTVGNGYLEVARDLQGIPRGLWHVPGVTVRLLSNLEGYVQISKGQNKHVYFKRYGDPRIMDNRTGEFVKGRKLKSLRLQDHAAEIIHFCDYNPTGTYYGFPKIYASENAIAGNKFSALRNVAFFQNDAVPRMAVIISGGGYLNQESVKRLEEIFSASAKGSALAHRVVVLQAKPGQSVGKPPTITLMPLTVGSTDDASFTKYTEFNNQELREAFGISELHLGTEGSANRASAAILLRLVSQQEFGPSIQGLEHRLNVTVTRDLGAEHAVLELVRPKVTDPLDDAKILQRMIPGGALSPKDLRRWIEKHLSFDLTPFEGEAWAAVPFSMLQTLIRTKSVGLGQELTHDIDASLQQVVQYLQDSEDSANDLEEQY